MFQTLKSCLTPSHPANTTARRFAPKVEALQDRLTPSAQVIGGHLIINGTSADDTVIVTQSGSNYNVWEKSNAYLAVPKSTSIPVASVTGDMVFKGFDGNDAFYNYTGERLYAYGGNGNDTLVGGTATDYLYGEAGDDRLLGQGGSDYLYGGAGNDWLYAAGDRNTDVVDWSYNLLDGGDGDDHLHGSEGGDVLRGGNGNDFLFGNGGNDVLLGQAGFDYLYGGDGNDTLDGGVGDGYRDYLNGGAGADRFRFDPYEDHGPWWSIAQQLFPLTINGDEPADFNSNEDSIYF